MAERAAVERRLAEVGLNTLWCDYTTPPAKLDEAVNLGFWVVPSLPATSEDSRLADDAGLTNEVARVQSQIGDAVLFWDLGGGLVEEQTERVNHAGQLVHAADPQRPLGADIWDGFRPYSRTLDAILGFLRDITEPFLRIFRRVIPSLGGFDFSPILAILTLAIFNSIVVQGIIHG